MLRTSRAQDRPVLTLVDLEAFDPTAPAGKVERDFCCPLPACVGKSTTTAHRSLSVNTDSGRWLCHRCHEAGTLREHWLPRKEAQRAAALHRFRVTPPAALQPPPPPPQEWMPTMVDAEPLEGTWGARYLEGRGISCEMATATGVLFTTCWYGHLAVLFPVCDRAGRLVATNGRHVNPTVEPKAMSAGQISRGVFQTTGALAVAQPVIAEAPIDALSLATVGIPAVALCGTHAPGWLHVGFRRVALAFDADEAGDQAAAVLWPVLTSFGIQVERWRPSVGKDWNDVLLAGGPFPTQEKTVSIPQEVPASIVEDPVQRCDWSGCNEPVRMVRLHDGSEELQCGYSHPQGWITI